MIFTLWGIILLHAPFPTMNGNKSSHHKSFIFCLFYAIFRVQGKALNRELSLCCCSHEGQQPYIFGFLFQVSDYNTQTTKNTILFGVFVKKQEEN